MPRRKTVTKSKASSKEAAKNLIEALGPDTPKGDIPDTPTIDSPLDSEEEDYDIGPFTPLQRFDTEDEESDDETSPVTPNDANFAVRSPVIDYKALNKIHADDPIHSKLISVGCAICCFITDNDLEHTLYVVCIDHKGRKIIIEIDEKEYASVRSHDIVNVTEREEYEGSHAIISMVKSKLSPSIYGAAVISDTEYHFMRFSDTGDIIENTYVVQGSVRNKPYAPKIYPIVRLSDLLAEPEYITSKIKESYIEFHNIHDDCNRLRKKEIVHEINVNGMAIKEFSIKSRDLNELICDEWGGLRKESIKYSKFLNEELSEEDIDRFEINRFNLSLLFQYFTRIFELHDSLKFDISRLREVEADVRKKIAEVDELTEKIKKRTVESGELDLKL